MKLCLVSLLCLINFKIYSKSSATVGQAFDAKPFCQVIEIEEPYTIAENLFCDANPQIFSGTEICQQMECLVNDHISHCDESLQGIAKSKSWYFMQGSIESVSLNSTYEMFCSEDKYPNFSIWD